MRPLLAVLALIPISAFVSAQAPLAPRLGDHLEATSALAREHQYHASVAGRVLLHDGSPAVGAQVLVYAYRPFYWALPLATARTDDDGAYRCDDITGCGRSLLWVVAPDDTPFRTAWASLTLVSGEHTELRPVTLPEPTGEALPATTFRGRLLAADGRPLPGATLRLTHAREAFDPSCFAVTDRDGSFAIPVRTGTPEQAQLFFGRNRLEIEHEAGTEVLTGDGGRLRLDLTGERTLQHEQIQLVDVAASGVDGITLDWQFADSFRPVVGGAVPALISDRSSSLPLLRATAPGHLPRLFPAAERISFAADVPSRLAVVDDAGKPVAALVDLCSDAYGTRWQETLLQSLPTAADGSLELLGPATGATVVYVYAKGHEPARALWQAGEPLRVTLARRSARLHLDIDDDSSSIYVRRAGTFDHAAVVYAAAGGLDLDLAPGTYEVTRYRDGPVVAAAPVTLAAGAATEMELTADLRPTIVVRVPTLPAGKGWWVHASRAAVGGMVANRAMWTTRGGPMPTRELAAEVEPQGETGFLLRLPTSGRYTVLVGHEQLAYRALREVVVQFGTAYELELPALGGVLRGTVAARPETWDSSFAMDGVAGPRLWLEPEGDTAFGVLVTLPAPDPFVVEQLPRGRFTLHHHLYETGFFRSEAGTWGGRSIEIGAEASDVGKLARGPDAELQVKVLTAAGEPATGTLSIRDRMSESWQQVIDENSTLIYASDPIPQPPSARLVDGVATLGKVRKGRLQFVLHADDGRSVFFARDVEPGEVLEVRLGGLR